MAQIFLARKLGPDVFGLFNVGMIIFTFSNFFATFGFGWSLLQIPDVQTDDIRFAFTWQLASGILVGIGMYSFAPVLATYFHDPRVSPVIRWLAVGCIFNAAASPATNLLIRDLNFRAIGLIDVGSYALGYIIVGIPLAISGKGVQALVAAWLAQGCARLVFSFAARPHSLRPLWWYNAASAVMSVGSTVFVTNFINWLLNNIDRLSIGRLLNTQAVGFYSVGYNLAMAPNSLLVGALQPAFFAASARMQDDRPRLGRAYLEIVAAISVLILPLFTFLATVAPDLIRLLYGPRWDRSETVLRLLFLAMPFYIAWGVSTPVLWNTGRRHYEALLQCPLLLTAAIAFYGVASNGLYAAASVAGGLLVSRGIVIGIAAFRAVGLNAGDLSPSLLGGCVLSVLVMTRALISQEIMSPLHSPALTLMVGTIVASASVLGALWARPTILGAQAPAMILRFIPRLKMHFVSFGVDRRPSGLAEVCAGEEATDLREQLSRR